MPQQSPDRGLSRMLITQVKKWAGITSRGLCWPVIGQLGMCKVMSALRFEVWLPRYQQERGYGRDHRSHCREDQRCVDGIARQRSPDRRTQRQARYVEAH